MLSELDRPRFTTADAAAAIGTTSASLMGKLDRGAIILSDDESHRTRNPGRGRSRLLSARRVLHLALTDALSKVGLPLAVSSQLALNFSDANGADETAGHLLDEAPEPVRMPGELYVAGHTVFRVLFDRSGTPIAGRVDRLASIAANPLLNDNTPCAAAIVIDLNALYDRTMSKLGIRP